MTGTREQQCCSGSPVAAGERAGGLVRTAGREKAKVGGTAAEGEWGLIDWRWDDLEESRASESGRAGLGAKGAATAL